MTRLKTALITGASSGLGLEFAKLFARDGFELVLVARNAMALEGLASELRDDAGVEVTVLPKDLCGPRAADEIHAELERRGVQVDVLVNNAGFNVCGPFVETDGDAEMEMLRVNILALTRLTKLFVPSMVERGLGRVLNIGSTGSFAPGPFDALYCASKAYVLSFSEAVAEELAGTGVTVTTLCPGPTKTAFADRAGIQDTALFRGSVAPADEVAAAGYRALMSGRRMLVPGVKNWLMTQSVRFAPRRLVAASSRRLLEPAS